MCCVPNRAKQRRGAGSEWTEMTKKTTEMFPFGLMLLQSVLGWPLWAAVSQDEQDLGASPTPSDLTLPNGPRTSPAVGHVLRWSVLHCQPQQLWF